MQSFHFDSFARPVQRKTTKKKLIFPHCKYGKCENVADIFQPRKKIRKFQKIKIKSDELKFAGKLSFKNFKLFSFWWKNIVQIYAN